jgi:hypothetical protein
MGTEPGASYAINTLSTERHGSRIYIRAAEDFPLPARLRMDLAIRLHAELEEHIRAFQSEHGSEVLLLAVRRKRATKAREGGHG